MEFDKVVNLLSSLFFSKNCSHALFIDNDIQSFIQSKCHYTLISKCLSYVIIVGSILVKFPQIIKICKSKSSKGLSFSAQVLELCAISTTVAYSFARQFPFSSYGEGLFLCVQTALIAFFVLFYRSNTIGSYLFLITYTLVMSFLMSPMAPLYLLALLQAVNLPIVAAGKLLQAFTNARQGHTGQLSLLTVVLLFFGCVARVFTTIQETGDQLVMFNYLIATVCNGILVLQIFYYWNSSSAVEQVRNKRFAKSKKIQ